MVLKVTLCPVGQELFDEWMKQLANPSSKDSRYLAMQAYFEHRSGVKSNGMRCSQCETVIPSPTNKQILPAGG